MGQLTERVPGPRESGVNPILQGRLRPREGTSSSGLPSRLGWNWDLILPYSRGSHLGVRGPGAWAQH